MSGDLLPLRLEPGVDLRRTLEAVPSAHRCEAAFVLSGIGSLRAASLRFAGQPGPHRLEGDLELLTLAGSIAPDGAHLHMSVADAAGAVSGGHVGYDCIVRTTAEVLIALLPAWSFARQADPRTGYAELAIVRREG